MIETIVIFVGKAAASAVFDAIKDKVLGIEYQEVSVKDWGKTAVLAIFAGQSLRPELSDQKKNELRFTNFQSQIDGVKKKIDDLKKDMAAFKWKVDTLFYKAREENLWQELLTIDSTLDDFDDVLSIDKPGEYYLKGAYQLNVRTPNPGLGGRPIAVEMQATLTPAD